MFKRLDTCTRFDWWNVKLKNSICREIRGWASINSTVTLFLLAQKQLINFNLDACGQLSPNQDFLVPGFKFLSRVVQRCSVATDWKPADSGDERDLRSLMLPTEIKSQPAIIKVYSPHMVNSCNNWSPETKLVKKHFHKGHERSTCSYLKNADNDNLN